MTEESEITGKGKVIVVVSVSCVRVSFIRPTFRRMLPAMIRGCVSFNAFTFSAVSSRRFSQSRIDVSVCFRDLAGLVLATFACPCMVCAVAAMISDRLRAMFSGSERLVFAEERRSSAIACAVRAVD